MIHVYYLIINESLKVATKSGLKAHSSTFNAIIKHLCCFSCRKQCSFFSYSHIFIRLVLNLVWFAEYRDGREFNMPSNKIVLTAFGKWWSSLNKICLLWVACVLNYCNWKELLDLRWRIAWYSTFCFFCSSSFCLQIPTPPVRSLVGVLFIFTYATPFLHWHQISSRCHTQTTTIATEIFETSLRRAFQWLNRLFARYFIVCCVNEWLSVHNSSSKC